MEGKTRKTKTGCEKEARNKTKTEEECEAGQVWVFFFKLLICLSVFNLGRLMKQKYGKSALRTQLRLPTSSPLLKFAIGNIIQTYFTAY